MSKSFFEAVILNSVKIYDQIMVKTYKTSNHSKVIKTQLKLAQFNAIFVNIFLGLFKSFLILKILLALKLV